ncbi:hypothetical protein K1719_036347 [Acacia pycnantha]|nr:hypothetical protein K1719_036347 [Acacia pycnantha]
MHFSDSKDKRPKLAVMPYYGVIEEIWEVDYVKVRFPIFKCKSCKTSVLYHEIKKIKCGAVALQGKRVIDIDEESHSNYDLPESTPFSRGLPDMKEEDEADNEPGIRNDHQEGIWEDITL